MWKRLGVWIVIVPALAIFSFSVVAQAAGVGKPNVASVAPQVVPKQPATHDDGVIVVVKHSEGDGGLGAALGGGNGKEVCWISKGQLARVSRAYRTATSSLTVGGRTYTIVTVYDADEKGLQAVLGVTPVQCKLVHVAHVFFLPFDPNIS